MRMQLVSLFSIGLFLSEIVSQCIRLTFADWHCQTVVGPLVVAKKKTLLTAYTNAMQPANSSSIINKNTFSIQSVASFESDENISESNLVHYKNYSKLRRNNFKTKRRRRRPRARKEELFGKKKNANKQISYSIAQMESLRSMKSFEAAATVAREHQVVVIDKELKKKRKHDGRSMERRRANAHCQIIREDQRWFKRLLIVCFLSLCLDHVVVVCSTGASKVFTQQQTESLTPAWLVSDSSLSSRPFEAREQRQQPSNESNKIQCKDCAAEAAPSPAPYDDNDERSSPRVARRNQAPQPGNRQQQQQQQAMRAEHGVTDQTTRGALKNVTAQNGQSVLLHCFVEPSSELSVSWFRGAAEPQLLTYESNTIIPDERFVVRHGLVKGDWPLQIKNLDKNTDAGLYQCQTNSEPAQSQYYQLNIVEPQVNILGAPDLVLKVGSAINLTCVISQSPDQLQFIFWYKENRMINYDMNERGKIVVSKWLQNKADTITSNLLIYNSKQADSANYTCQPSGARSASIYVHVLEGSDKRLIMFQNDQAAASSQLANSSAISLHVVRLSRGRVYALFIGLIIFASWFQLVAQLQTAISLTLLAIIGLFLGNMTDGRRRPPEHCHALALKLNSEKISPERRKQLQAAPLKSLSLSEESLNVSRKQLEQAQNTSPSASASSASTGYNSDNYTLEHSSPVPNDEQLLQALANNKPASHSSLFEAFQVGQEMIELVKQPTALSLVMEELSPLKKDQESHYSAPVLSSKVSNAICD